ncbi:transcriptional regulator with XRE-family HTH domain [Bradyrhizobium sp. AZCC 1678]|uniref:P-loop NTPase n=1 Tax=Bradyrhizobium sp. AZCC 1678 TaxID=3117030 RepID=UPI002FF1426A
MNTQKARTSKQSAKYARFGQLLARLRMAARIERQADFANMLEATQQTVSRWEAGLSRPRESQIPQIATALGVEPDELLEAAGYSVPTVVASFDKPFPVDALSPETFERLCAYLVQRMHPDAEIHLAGGRGHTQDGTDVLMTLPDGTKYSFQCKRTEEFGPQKVHAAIAKHTIKANKKILVLSRVASPQTREALTMHKGWALWDKDDLSLKIRALDKVDQLALVDTFFAGRRFELLGISEEGVWETSAEFFAAFQSETALFNHTWKLVGRTEPLQELVNYLDEDKTRIVFLIGSGGSGKSRVLKDAIETYEASHKGTRVRFLARTAEATKRSLEELGETPSLLVVDDAHDRSDLPILFQHAATTDHTKLVLALRPYGLDHLKAQASNYSLIEMVRDVKLASLSKTDAETLAKQVLKKENGPLEAAKDIANLTYDCPLATVVGAQIVARDKKQFDLAKNEDAFRSTLFGRFENVIAGELGQKSDGEPIKKLLGAISLFQPFYLDDPQLLKLIQELEGIAPHDTSRLFKLLIDAGVLFKRGAKYRLSPDVLADYVIEAACVGVGRQSTGYAETAFDLAGDRLADNLLLNLGKLDWRLSNGDASNSDLLNGVWRKLKPRSDYQDPHIRAVEGVAYYQPLRAIEFGEALIRRGEFTSQLSTLFKYAAFNLSYLERACSALWELGKDDRRELHSHPNHPIRTLAELCEVAPNKPLIFNEKIVEFALQLADDPTAWNAHYTPLDVLKAIFQTEGHTTESKNHTVTFKPFTVAAKAVASLRKRAVTTTIALLGSPNIRVATKAAEALGHALHYPRGMFNAKVDKSLYDEWTAIFCETMGEIERAVRSHAYDPLVLVGLVKAISWHDQYSNTATSKPAKKLKKLLTASLDYRVFATLSDGYGMEFRRFNPKTHEAEWDKYLKSLASELIAKFALGEDLRQFIAEQLEHIRAANPNASASPHVLYGALLRASPTLPEATIAEALQNPVSPTARFVGDALLTLWLKDVSAGRSKMQQLLRCSNPDLHASVGRAIQGISLAQRAYGPEEADALEQLLSSEHEWTVYSGIHALRSLSRANAEDALRLARRTNVGATPRLADELLCLFGFGEELPFHLLSEADVKLFFDKLMAIPKLDGHWTEVFLSNASKSFPDLTLDFLIARIEKAVSTNSWNYRPTNHGPYVHVPLKLREAPNYGALLAKTVQWISNARYEKDQRVLFNYRARELFEAAFGEFDEEVVAFLARWSETADEAGFKIMSNLLEEAPHTFVFTHKDFVFKLMSRAKRVGDKALEYVGSALFSASVGGMRQGTAGEPFPRDVETKESAEQILATLSKFSPVYELYDSLLKNAQGEIARSLREREEFED